MGDTTILLKKTEVLVLHSARDAYYICSGTVIVYIVPWNAKEQQAGKRVKLCEVEVEKTIPGFVWRDQDYQEWRFALVPKSEEAELRTIENGATLVLKKRFLSNAGIDSYDMEMPLQAGSVRLGHPALPSLRLSFLLCASRSSSGLEKPQAGFITACSCCC